MDTTDPGLLPGTRLPVAAAAGASFALSALGAYWLARDVPNPLDRPDRKFSSALAAYPDGWANGIFLTCAVIALAGALWLLASRRARAVVPWVAGASIVALLMLMDGSNLILAGYLPAILVGSVLGFDEVNPSVLLSPGLALQLTLLCTVAAFGVIIAGRLRLGLGDTGPAVTEAERARRLARAKARTRFWTKIAIEAPALYALTRVLMFFCVPGFDMFGFGEPILWAGLGLAVSAAAGAWLTSGLIRPWGEVFPRWIPVLRGRRVPIRLAVVPGLVVAVMVATTAKDLLLTFATSDSALTAVTDWPLVTLPMLLWPLWAFALAMAAAAYGLRRRLSEAEPAPVSRSGNSEPDVG
ncbi:hypothetical protein Q5425_36965 [Amycolatopsis sp. A133]|uniref:hypothetical protein n=1 Tax=Amycolatopsis sp. A133 TaxID=3064472 RepID=UPI0027F6C8F6|nr:hypothetical protein [Amycolatopsis sp. A133]MDQ7809350.1 hypothetical protein [Amycolatopsis sp. A133]